MNTNHVSEGIESTHRNGAFQSMPFPNSAFLFHKTKEITLSSDIIASGPTASTISFFIIADCRNRQIHVCNKQVGLLYSIPFAPTPPIKNMPSSVNFGITPGLGDTLWISDILYQTIIHYDLSKREIISQHEATLNGQPVYIPNLFTVDSNVFAVAYSDTAYTPKTGRTFRFPLDDWSSSRMQPLFDRLGDHVLPTLFVQSAQDQWIAFDAFNFKRLRHFEFLVFDSTLQLLDTIPFSLLRLEYPATMVYDKDAGLHFAIDAIQMQIVILDENLHYIRTIKGDKNNYAGYPLTHNGETFIYNAWSNAFDVFK